MHDCRGSFASGLGEILPGCLQIEFGEQFLDAEPVVRGDGFQDATEQGAGFLAGDGWKP